MTAGCGSHPGFPHELRSLALTALDRLDPVLDRIRAEPVAGTPFAESPCAVCPVCVVISVLRGERSELAVRLAEQAAGLVAVLRAALEDTDSRDGGGPGPEGQGDAGEVERGHSVASTRAVQHIPVSR